MSTSAPSAVVCRRTLLFALLAATAGITKVQAATRADDLMVRAKQLTADEAKTLALALDGTRLVQTAATSGRVLEFGFATLGQTSVDMKRALQFGSWSLRVLTMSEPELGRCFRQYGASLGKLDVKLETFNALAAEQLKLLAA